MRRCCSPDCACPPESYWVAGESVCLNLYRQHVYTPVRPLPVLVASGRLDEASAERVEFTVGRLAYEHRLILLRAEDAPVLLYAQRFGASYAVVGSRRQPPQGVPQSCYLRVIGDGLVSCAEYLVQASKAVILIGHPALEIDLIERLARRWRRSLYKPSLVPAAG